MTRKEQLKADLLKNFSDFQKIDPNVAPGGSDAANSIVAEGLADSIDRAIDDGIDLTFKGILRCSEINLLTDKKSGDLYTCADAGVLNGSVQLPVTKTSVVLWTGDRFKLFLVVPEQVTPGSQISIDGFFSQTSRNPVENRLVTAALAATINAINLHVQNQENPHGVTAAQVGADPEGTAETLVSNHNSDESAHADIRQLIEDEADERTDADTALQQQIDAIVSKSDVVAIVGTYVDLLALDTSTMFDNDIVKVLSDESRQGKKTYYSWNIASEAWTYIGSEAETYTKSEVNSLLNSKANKVSGATNGHLAGLDGNGNLTDSGVSPSDISSGIFIAEYGTTTIAQIEAAYNANKAMLVKMGGGNPGIALFTTRYTINGVHSYWFYRKYGRDYGANEDQHYAYVYIDSLGWHDYSFTSPKNRHSSTTDEYGAGSESNYGHVQLTNSVTQNSTKAITSGAVYNALQNLPQPTQEVFIAEYGVTTFGDIINAINAGKIVVCHYSFNDKHYDAYLPAHYTYLGFVVYFSGLVDDLYICVSAIISNDNVTTWSAPETKLGTLLSNIKRGGSESNYVTERGTIKPIPPSAYPAITKDADYTIQTSTVVTLQQTNRLYKIHVRPSSGPHGDVRLNVSTGLTGVVFLDLKVGYDSSGCIYYTYNANYLKWTDIFGVEQKMRLYPDRYDGQYMPGINTDKTYFRLKVECYNGEIIAVTSFGDLHFEASGLVAQSVNSYKIADNSVTGPKIADSSVAPRHLSGIDLKYFIDGAATGSYVEDDEYFAATTSNTGLKYTAKTARAYMNARAYARLTFTAKSSYNTTSSGRLFNGVNHVESFSISSRADGYIHGLFGHHANLVILDLRKSGSWTDTLDLYFNIDQIWPGVPYTLMVYNRTGNSVHITFRVNGGKALTNCYANGITTTGNKKYVIDANSLENILIERDGNDLYLNAIWHGM